MTSRIPLKFKNHLCLHISLYKKTLKYKEAPNNVIGITYIKEENGQVTEKYAFRKILVVLTASINCTFKTDCKEQHNFDW